MGNFEKNKLLFLSIFDKRLQFLIKKKKKPKPLKIQLKILWKYLDFHLNVCGIIENQTILQGEKKKWFPVFVQKILTLRKISTQMFALV